MVAKVEEPSETSWVLGHMGNGWEGLVGSGKIMEDSGNCGELESQDKQGFQTVETNKILGWPTNTHPNQAQRLPVCNL